MTRSLRVCSLLFLALLWSSNVHGVRKEKLQTVMSADDGTDPGAPPADLDHTGDIDDEEDANFGFEDEDVPAADVIPDPPLHWVGSHKSGSCIPLNATSSVWKSPFTMILKVLPHHTSSHGPTAAAMEAQIRSVLSKMRGEKVEGEHANEVKRKECMKACSAGSEHPLKGDNLKCVDECIAGKVADAQRKASGKDVVSLVKCVEEAQFVTMAWWCVRKFHGHNDTKPLVGGPNEGAAESDMLKDVGAEDEPPLPDDGSAVEGDNSTTHSNATAVNTARAQKKPLVHVPVVMKQHKPLGKAIDKKHLACLKSSLFGANDDEETRAEALEAVMSVCMKRTASSSELTCLNKCIDGMKGEDGMESTKQAALCSWSCFEGDVADMSDLTETPSKHHSDNSGDMLECVSMCLTANTKLQVQKVISCAHKCQVHQNGLQSMTRNAARAILHRRASHEVRVHTSECLKRARGDDKDVAFTSGDVQIAKTCVLRSIRRQYDQHLLGVYVVDNKHVPAVKRAEEENSGMLEKCIWQCFHRVPLRFSMGLGVDSEIPKCARECGTQYYGKVHKVEVRLEDEEIESGLVKGDKCGVVCMRKVIDLARMFDMPTATQCIVRCYQPIHSTMTSAMVASGDGDTLEMNEPHHHKSAEASKSCGKHCVGRCTGTEGLSLPEKPRPEDVQCVFSCLKEKECMGSDEKRPDPGRQSNSTVVETVVRQGCSFFLGTVNGVWKYGAPPVEACSASSQALTNLHNLFPEVMTTGLMVRKKPMMIALSVQDDGSTLVYLNGQRANKFQWTPQAVMHDPNAAVHAPRIDDVNDLSVSGVIGEDEPMSDGTSGENLSPTEKPNKPKVVPKEQHEKPALKAKTTAKRAKATVNMRGVVKLNEEVSPVVKPDLITGMGNIAEGLIMAGQMSFDERVPVEKSRTMTDSENTRSGHGQEMLHFGCVSQCMQSDALPLEKKQCVIKCLSSSSKADRADALSHVSKQRVEECSVCISNCIEQLKTSNQTHSGAGQCVADCVHPSHRCNNDTPQLMPTNSTLVHIGVNGTLSNSTSTNSTSTNSTSARDEGLMDDWKQNKSNTGEPDDLHNVFEDGPGREMDGWNAVVIGDNYDGVVCGVSIWEEVLPDLDIYHYSKQRNDEYMKQEHGDTCGVVHLPHSPPPEANSHEHPEDWQPRPVEAFFGDTSHHLGGKPAWHWNLNVQSNRVIETGDEIPTDFWPDGFSVVATVWAQYAARSQVLALVGPSQCGGMQLLVRNGNWAFGQRCGDVVEFRHAKFREGRLYGVAVVYDKRSRQATLYLNGVEEEVKEIDIKRFTNDSGEIVVGSDDKAGTIHFWRGEICDVAVYKGLANIGTLSAIKDYGCSKNSHSPTWSFLQVLSKQVKTVSSKPLPGDMYPNKGFTIAARVKYVARTGLGNGERDSQVVVYRGKGTNDCSGFMLSVEDGEWYFGNPCEKLRRSGLRALSGRHYSLVVSYGPNSVKWYINGQHRPGHVAYSTMGSTGNMYVGAKDQKMASGQWLGAICGVKIFHGVLPKKEVSAMYQWSLDHLQDLCTPEENHVALAGGPAWSWNGATGVQLGQDIQTGTLEPDVPKDMWGGEFTITVKIRTARVDDGSWQDIVSRGSSCGGVLLALFEKHLYFGRNCKPHPDTGVVLLDDTSYLVAVAYSQKSGVARVYVDGSLEGTVNVPLHLDSDDDLYIGGADAAGNEHVMKGRVCAVDIYEGALSEGRIEKSISGHQEAPGSNADPCDD